MFRSRTVQVFSLAVALMVGLAVGTVAQSDSVGDATPEPVPGSPAPAVESAPMGAPPEIDGLGWADVSELIGEEIEAAATERSLGEWVALLDGTGATFEQASQLNARAVEPETDETIGIYSAIRIAGADEGQLREAMFDVLRLGSEAETYTFDEAQIGGKEVTIITRDTDERAFMYVEEDTVHLLDLPEEQLSAILDLLP